MTEDLDTRLQRLQASDDVYALIDLGCDLADVGRQTDAEWCFRRAAELGDTVGSFNLGNALAAQKRWARRWTPTRSRWPAGRSMRGATSARSWRTSVTWPGPCGPTAA